MKNTLILATLLFCFSFTAFSQKKKELASGNIIAKTEWNTEYKNGVEYKYKESEYKYDQNGNVLLEKEYSDKGILLKHTEFQYDKDGKIVVVLHYNAKKQLIKREEFTYKGNLKTEKRVFGADKKMKSKKTYDYISN